MSFRAEFPKDHHGSSATYRVETTSAVPIRGSKKRVFRVKGSSVHDAVSKVRSRYADKGIRIEHAEMIEGK